MINHLEVLKEKLAIDFNIWFIAFEKYEANELHFVIRRRYEKNIVKLIRKQNPEDVYCSFGIHIYDIENPRNSKVVIKTAVYDHEFKEYQLNKQVFKRRISIPIDIEINNLINASNDNITLNVDGCKLEKNIVNYAYKMHTLPTHFIRGVWIRFKLVFIKDFMWKIPSLLFGICRAILYIIDGTRTKKDVIEVHINESDGRTKGNSFKEDTYLIEFMSIQVKSFSAFTYSLLHLVAAYAYLTLGLSNEFISKVANNVFLGLTYVVVTLTVWSRFIPNILKFLIKWLAKISCKDHKGIRV